MKQTGSFTIMTAILIPTILIYFTVIIEINNYYLKRQQLATSADIAALAGAAQLGIANNTIIASATNYFNANNNNTESQISITIGHWNANNKTFTPTTTNPNAIQANASEPFISTNFESLNSINASSIATKNPLSSASYLVQ